MNPTVKDMLKMPIFALSIFLVSFFGIYFEIPLMIPPFAVTLFMIYMRKDSEFVHFKNIIGGHLIAFCCAFLEPILVAHVSFASGIMTRAAVVGIAVLIAGWLMTILKVQHPPALATTLLFFNVKPEGLVVFGTIPLASLLSFLMCLLIVAAIADLLLLHEQGDLRA